MCCYPCVEVSVYEARSTKCVRQCCHIEGFVFLRIHQKLMADNAITCDRILGLGSLLYICGCRPFL